MTFVYAILSKCFGFIASIYLPKPFNIIILWPLSQCLNINLKEASKPLSNYYTFQSLFTRKLRPGTRPVSPVEWVCPVDGQLVSFFEKIQQNHKFNVKRGHFNLRDLLDQTPQNCDMSLYNFYLSPRDYHRFVMPTECIVKSIKKVPGKLYSVNPAFCLKNMSIYSENERVVLTCQSAIGTWYMVIVAALNVGKIKLPWAYQFEEKNGNVKFKKGEECGWFEMGSTILIAVPSNHGLKTYLKTGDYLRVGQSMLG